MKVRLMLVPGKIVTVEVPEGSTVLDACTAASQNTETKLSGDKQWDEYAKKRQVRVQNKKYSNVKEINEKDGYCGSIWTTPLKDGYVVLILTKIEGNESGGVKMFTIDGDEYALDDEEYCYGDYLADVLDVDVDTIDYIVVNGEKQEDLDCIIKAGDVAEVHYDKDTAAGDSSEEEGSESSEAITCKIDGEEYVLDEPCSYKEYLEDTLCVDLETVVFITVNGAAAELDCKIKNGDVAEVHYRRGGVDLPTE